MTPHQSAADHEQLPMALDTLQPLAATILQDDLGAGEQAMDGPEHDDLAGAGRGHDPRGDVDGDPTDVIAAQLDLTDVRIANGEFSAQFALSLALKDVRLALQAADQDPLAALACLAQEWQQAVDQGLGDQDLTVVTRLLEQQEGGVP